MIVKVAFQKQENVTFYHEPKSSGQSNKYKAIVLAVKTDAMRGRGTK